VTNQVSYETNDDSIPEIRTVEDLHRYVESLRDLIPDPELLREIQIRINKRSDRKNYRFLILQRYPIEVAWLFVNGGSYLFAHSFGRLHSSR